MGKESVIRSNYLWPKIEDAPLPVKVLATLVLLTLAIAMLGALGQIIIHDIIPTFMGIQVEGNSSVHSETASTTNHSQAADTGGSRGDLFGEKATLEKQPNRKSFYKTEHFVWMLKWTHIHLFGMNMIFIFMAAITLFLDLGNKTRSWLIGLPFVGVLMDIAAMWLKAYISPHFFWLHVPSGGLFGVVFAYVWIRAIWEMWGRRQAIG